MVLIEIAEKLCVVAYKTKTTLKNFCLFLVQHKHIC